jgi:hypothetical protein
MLAGLLAYFANFFVGKNKNTKLANLWLHTHKSLLEENFSLIGEKIMRERLFRHILKSNFFFQKF